MIIELTLVERRGEEGQLAAKEEQQKCLYVCRSNVCLYIQTW